MLIADRRGIVRVRYEVRDTAPGPSAIPPTKLALSRWDRAVEFEHDSMEYTAWLKRRFLMGHEGRLLAGDRELAHAEGIGTSDWELDAEDRRYRFVRPNPLTHTQQLIEAGEPIGVVRRRALGVRRRGQPARRATPATAVRPRRPTAGLGGGDELTSSGQPPPDRRPVTASGDQLA